MMKERYNLKLFLKKFPLFLIISAVYPVISLYGHNITEISLPYIVRPLLVSCVLAVILYLITLLIFRNRQVSAIITSILYLGLMSYGTFFQLLKGLSIGSTLVGRQRYFIILFALGMALLIWLLMKWQKTAKDFTLGFNLVALSLLVLPAYQILANASLLFPAQSQNKNPINLTKTSQYPDIYYIILDSYARADYIQKFVGYDNSAFLDGLRSEGFYIADCGMSNYSMTRLSLTSSLNMTHVLDLDPTLTPDKAEESIVDDYVRHNAVRKRLEALGYTTIAFETGYPFTEWTDADIYFETDSNPVSMPMISEFEKLALENSFASVFTSIPTVKKALGLDFPYQEQYLRQHFILDQLTTVPEISGSKFVFAHLVTTHKPYMFNPDGTALVNEKFYANDGVPVNDDYLFLGYKYQLEFTDRVILKLVKEIINQSEIPPVIILQGDHGLRAPGRNAILNAILLPGGSDKLYPALTPVNTFGIVFNQLFGDAYEMQADSSYFSRYVTPFQFEDLTTGYDVCQLETPK